MYKLSVARMQEITEKVRNISGDKTLLVSDIFYENEATNAAWEDKTNIAKEILLRNQLRYTDIKDLIYRFDKVWIQTERTRRSIVTDLIRNKAKAEDYPTSDLPISSYEKEIINECKTFPLKDYQTLESTRYKKYVFNNGTLHFNQIDGSYNFVAGHDPNDNIRMEDNRPFDYDFTESIAGVENILEVFCEWGIPVKQTIYILSYVLFFEKDFLHYIYYLVGEGENGKSQFMRLLEYLFPKNAITHLDISKLNGDKDGTEALESSFANISGEIRMEDFAADFVKKLTGGDKIGVNPKNEKPFTIVPTAKHFASSNSIPRLKETSHGDLRRFFIIEFNNKFPKAENFFSNRIEPYIPQLFTLCLKQAAKIKKNGMYIRKSSIGKTTDLIQTESNKVYEFIKEFDIKIDPVEYIDERTLFRYFGRWVEEGGLKNYSLKRVRSQLKSLLGKEINHPGHKYGLYITFNSELLRYKDEEYKNG